MLMLDAHNNLGLIKGKPTFRLPHTHTYFGPDLLRLRSTANFCS